MEYTSIHIYGHFLSDDILHSIERDNTLIGNREQDFGLDAQVQHTIDYVWSSFRNDWKFFNERSIVGDQYGTRRSRDLMERLFTCLGYELTRQTANIQVNGSSFDISYLCNDLKDLPIIVIGDKTGDANIDTLDKCTLDYRAKGTQRRKSPHATMLEYLNNTENVYGIIANGRILRILRNTGQLVKLTYIEFDLQRMLEEDKYTEFCLMFRLLHATRFRVSGDEQCIMERYFNMSIESGNRIRDGLSMAVQRTMEIIGKAAVMGAGEGNEALRQAITTGKLSPIKFNKELIHFIYRLLFLFIIEDRGLVYQIPAPESEDYKRICKLQEIYKLYYAASRLRKKSELLYLRNRHYYDLWQGLMDTFRLFENEKFGEPLGIKPLGGVLFNSDTLHYLKACTINNEALLSAFSELNEFTDERQQRVKINYSSLDVEEFGSVYEGILEKHPFVTQGLSSSNWDFGFVGGLDRQSTSSYYTRPDLVQSLIKTTLIPVIEQKIAACTTKEEKVKALLNMKVCDPASGSGHIVLAMARTIAWYVCTIRTGEDNPASLDYREALREVIQRCIYAVDYNPDAVELCKVVLWIEGYCAGKPLSFLDHHIRCGNSVVGVTNLDMLLDGVPNEAFCAEDRDTLKIIKALNKRELETVKILRSGQVAGVSASLFDGDTFVHSITEEQVGLAKEVQKISAMPETSLLEAVTKQKHWEDLMESPRVECLRLACCIYTYAFYKQFKADDVKEATDIETFRLKDVPYTHTVYHALEEIKHQDEATSDYTPLPNEFKREVMLAARAQRFFHWCVEFPEVFAYDGGFDVMCGNPPWDKIKVEDKKWFESHGRSDIVNAGTAAQRKRAIAALPNTEPTLYEEYCQAQKDADSMSRFVRFAGRFKLTATGDIDLYPMFAEHCLSSSCDAWGLVMPTGIAINDSTKDFFAKIVDENRIISLFDFENRERLFAIDSRFKFCLLTAGNKQDTPREVNCGFYLTRLDHLQDSNRVYTLKSSDISLMNPNTKTCSVFRTSMDAQLTASIYRRCGILMNDFTKENPWGIKFNRMFDMSNDSHLFKTYQQIIDLGGTYKNGNFLLDGETFVPLYEGKMFWHFNHHFGIWPVEGERPNTINSPSIELLRDFNAPIIPWFWISISEVKKRLITTNRDNEVVWEWKHNWLFAYRCISNATNERTFISSIIPINSGIGNSGTVVYPSCSTKEACLLLANCESIVLDYVTRQKVGGSNFNTFFVKQFPILPPKQYDNAIVLPIIKRVVQLCYFNHDLDGWAEELWEELDDTQRAELPQLGNKQPFVFDPERRAVLQAELDAIFAHLYGLTTDELRYILDPEDICGVGCINQTFRVLKDNEIRQYGEYRTKRLVMEAWKKFGYDN